MSVKASAWAWEQQVPSTVKFVLVALADNADDDGVCWPGQKFVAEKTGLTKRSVNKSVAKLVDLKLIEVQHRHDQVGRPISNMYQLCVKRVGKGNDVPLYSEPNGQGIGNDVPTESSLRTINEPNTFDEVEIGFQVFYDAYPRHEGRRGAFKAWSTLKPDAVLADTIMLDVERFRDRERRFIPLPATYLRGRRWEDEQPVAAVARAVPIHARVKEWLVEPPPTPEQAAANRAILHGIIEKLAAR